MRTKIYMSAFEYCQELGRNLLYASLADHNTWFDNWPGLSDFDPAHRPFQMTFGDDTVFSPEEMRQLIDVYDECGIRVPWNVGDISIVCNFRWLHGRPEFELEPK